jgi:hypothetical protein
MRMRRVGPPPALFRLRRGFRIGASRSDDRGERGEFLRGGLAPDDAKLHAHSGMFPCFLGGGAWRLLRSMRSDRMTYERVFDGGITEST